MAEPIYDFARDNLIPREQIKLTIELDEESIAFQGHMDYLVSVGSLLIMGS